jgi:alpha-ketoglutarate-dependent taurine dioxygenase
MNWYEEIFYSEFLLKETLPTTKVVKVKTDPSLADRLYSTLPNILGKPKVMDEDLKSGGKNGGMWTEIKYDSSVKDSFRHANVRQPLHTDGAYESDAPEISFIYCKQPSKHGGSTTFIDSEMVLELALAFGVDTELLFNTPVKFSKGGDGKTAPILAKDDIGTILNWNYYRVVEATQMTEKFHSFLEHVAQSGLCMPVKLSAGEGVFFHDKRLLHGRDSFIGSRHLMKAGFDLTH